MARNDKNNAINNNANKNTKSKTASKLPMMSLKEVPKARKDAKQIVALVKEGGIVTGYKLSNGKVLNKEEGVALAKKGGIEGVGISTRKGNEYLKSLPDGKEKNNLSNLPSVSKK